jgi:hypothetical protein
MHVTVETEAERLFAAEAEAAHREAKERYEQQLREASEEFFRQEEARREVTEVEFAI